MSDNKILPISILSFLAGAFVGSVVALLYAPKSGEELRTQIRAEADATAKRASAEWNRAMQDIQHQIEESQTQVKGYMSQLQIQGKADKPAADDNPAE